MASEAHESSNYNPKCLFCRIAHNMEPNSRLLFEKENVVIFKDIKPATSHHYLVVPKDHVKNPKYLGFSDVDMVEKLVSVGREYLHSVAGDVDDILQGFHWPPFNSIDHLHLHVIFPATTMGFLASLIFKPNSWWFVTANWLVNRLKNMQ